MTRAGLTAWVGVASLLVAEIAGHRGKVTPNAWHDLAVEARGDHLQVFFDGKAIIDTHDRTFGGAGKSGLWTKADSVTYFDDLAIQPLGPCQKVTP